MRAALICAWWGAALWVEGLKPLGVTQNEGCPHWWWGEALWVEKLKSHEERAAFIGGGTVTTTATVTATATENAIATAFRFLGSSCHPLS